MRSMTEPTRHDIRQTTATGPHGGPSWSYRGALIHSNPRGTLFGLEGGPADLPGNWTGVGSAKVLTRVLDGWLDRRRLPAPYITRV